MTDPHARKRRILQSPKTSIVFSAILLLIPLHTCVSKLEPYVLNGGLVSAIAGEDYVVVASDTRLSDGSYEILSRNYLDSRIWVATPGWDLAPMELVESECIGKDGTFVIPSMVGSVPSILNANTHSRYPQKETVKSDSSTLYPTLVASAGCASDCEALKRLVRKELASYLHWNHGVNTISANGIATLLGQVLYLRRGFPFYSFCILAGMEDNGSGVVHIYDAIGSHERVAVASAGTGREMLQPILDQLFATYDSIHAGEGNGSLDKKNGSHLQQQTERKIRRDGRAVEASNQRFGLELSPPVKTCVECSAEEAIALLVKGYRSVAEREIGVGDDVVVCLLKKINGISSPDMKVMRFPLKKH